MQTLFCYDLVEHWSRTNSKRRMRPIVNPQYRLLAIGTKEFTMDHLLLKRSDNFCWYPSTCPTYSRCSCEICDLTIRCDKVLFCDAVDG